MRFGLLTLYTMLQFNLQKFKLANFNIFKA
jgi:hypothetical protein